MPAAQSLKTFLSEQSSVIRIALTRVRGSSPRNEGTEMFVAPNALWGTIGGGQLEFMAINAARDMLQDGSLNRDMDVPLGPEIGQCCGGRVEITLRLMDAEDRARAMGEVTATQEAQPHVYIFGAGHVGRELSNLFNHLPVKAHLVDSRSEELAMNVCPATMSS